MSGHSKWSTIKHKKEVTDSARGKLFSRVARGITIAIKTGGGPNPETNYKLRMAIDAAKAVNMPKINIERALSKASEIQDLSEAVYEGFLPGGAGVLVEVATDNKNRSIQEIKQLFDRGGGQIAGPGAVSFNFKPTGMLVIKKAADSETQMLEMIDAGIEDVEETDDEIEAYVDPKKLSETQIRLTEKGFEVKSAQLIQKPSLMHKVEDEKQLKKAIELLENLEDNDDVQNVFTNLDIPDEMLN